MAVAFLIPVMYKHLLEEAGIKCPDNLGSCILPSDISDEYPHCRFFVYLHLGQAFSAETMRRNAEAIAKIPADKLPNLTFAQAQTVFGIEIDGEETLD